MPAAKFFKQPTETLDYDVDYERFFEDIPTDQIATVAVMVSGDAGGPVLQSFQAVGTPKWRAKVWVTAGTNLKKSQFSVRATSDGGRVIETDFIIQNREV